MFFRREKPKHLTFDERLAVLKDVGFASRKEGSGRAVVSKLGCAAVLEDNGDAPPNVGKAGIQVGEEIGYMVHGGYQMFFRTPSGKKIAALAEHLKALHDFQEDLKEGLGLISLYNTSLGTTADQHMYDRVASRDKGEPRRPWEH
jgi:hypothetical protein